MLHLNVKVHFYIKTFLYKNLIQNELLKLNLTIGNLYLSKFKVQCQQPTQSTLQVNNNNNNNNMRPNLFYRLTTLFVNFIIFFNNSKRTSFLYVFVCVCVYLFFLLQ